MVAERKESLINAMWKWLTRAHDLSFISQALLVSQLSFSYPGPRVAAPAFAEAKKGVITLSLFS